MITVNPNILRHHQTDFAKVCKYAKLMQDGGIFTPIDVHINEKGEYIVCDGAQGRGSQIVRYGCRDNCSQQS